MICLCHVYFWFLCALLFFVLFFRRTVETAPLKNIKIQFKPVALYSFKIADSSRMYKSLDENSSETVELKVDNVSSHKNRALFKKSAVAAVL